MSGLRGNPHYQHESIRNTHTNAGLISATLALAYEQRTANMIAILALPYLEATESNLLAVDAIRERL